jgi:AbrB family looped-hinge helix DNA binding protein
MRITSKGQVTIPKDVRDKLELAPGSEVAFEDRNGEIVLVKKHLDRRETDGLALVRQLRELGERARREGWTSGLSGQDIMEATRGLADGIKPR